MRSGGHTGSRVVLMVSWGLFLAVVSTMTAEEPVPRLVTGSLWEIAPGETAVRHALLIAPGRCADTRLPETPLAVADMQRLGATLRDPRLGRFPSEGTYLLAGDEATLPNIRREFARLKFVGRDDVVLIFLSGYAASEGGKVYWLTRESEAGALAGTALSHAELSLLLGSIPSRRVFLVVEMFDASVAASGSGIARAEVAPVLPTLQREGRGILFVERSGTRWIELGGVRQGILTHCVIQGLQGEADGNGDGSVNVAELWRHIEYQMFQEADRQGHPIRPVLLLGSGFEPDRVALTVNPNPEDVNRGRLESLMKLLGAGRISGSEYDEGRRLLTSQLLREVEREQREIYEDLADGRTDAQTARIALSAAGVRRPADNAGDAPYAALPATFRNSLRMDMVLVPEGRFEMGSRRSAEWLSMRFGGPPEWFAPEFPQHPVRIARPLYLSTCEVTVAQFRVFAEETGYRTDAEKGGQSFESGKRGGYTVLPDGDWGWRDTASWRNPGFDQTDDDPVVMVSWNDADMFCKWLSARDNRDYRLPTEAEWEYAARAGGTTLFWWGDGFDGRHMSEPREETRLVSWLPFDRESLHTHPVGQFRANGFGLHDVAGNVWEWCGDWYDRSYYADSPVVDPRGPARGVYRVIRGGAWRDNPRYCRSSCRNGYRPAGRHGLIGFRLAVEAQ